MLEARVSAKWLKILEKRRLGMGLVSGGGRMSQVLGQIKPLHVGKAGFWPGEEEGTQTTSLKEYRVKF